MKYVTVWCEDLARASDGTAALLEGAKVAHLVHLAQAGAAGLLRARRGGALDRFELHRALVGLAPSDTRAQAGQCYAADAGLTLSEGETAWCCDLVTQQDGRVIDTTAGGIPTAESRELLDAIREQLGSESRRWEIGHGSRHLLITRDPSLGAENGAEVAPPERLAQERWKLRLPKGALRQPLRLLIEQASKILEDHPVNRVRLDLGENPANMVWLWGAAGPSAASAAVGESPSGTVVSRQFPLRGLARLMNWEWLEAPARLEEPAIHALQQQCLERAERHERVYLHISITSADPMERQCEMDRLDQLLLRPLTETLPRFGDWRLLALVEDRQNGGAPWVAAGTGVPSLPVARLTIDEVLRRGRVFHDGSKLFSWFTQANA